MRVLLVLLLLALLAAGLLLLWTLDRVDPAAVEDNLHRERAVAAASVEDWGRALEAMRPLVERADPAVADLVRAGSLHLEQSRMAEAQALFERAAALAPEDPHVLWGRYRIPYEEGRFEEALPLVEAVHARYPDDFPTKLALANTLADLDRMADAVPHYEALMELGLDHGGSWYVSAVYRFSSLLRRQGDAERADELLAEYQRLQEQGITVPDAKDMRRGSFGQVAAPPPGEVEVDAKTRLALLGDGGAPTGWSARPPVEVPGGLAGLAATRVDDEVLPPDALAREHAVAPTPLDLLVWGPGGVAFVRRGPAGWTSTTVTSEPTTAAAALNLDPFDPVRKAHDRDGRIDVVAATSSGLRLFLASAGGDAVRWEPHGDSLLDPGFEVARLTPVDFDHEGDVDLLVVGPGGARLLRNDGVPAQGASFTDVTAAAGLPTEGSFAWAAIEDLDSDSDVDLLFGGPDGAFYAKNERGGTFFDASASLPPGLHAEPALVDLTRDMRPELVVRTPAGLAIHANRIEDRFVAVDEAVLSGADASPALTPVVGDLGDVDALQLVLPADGGLARVGLAGATPSGALEGAAFTPRYLVRGDVTGDGVDDLVVADENGFQILEARTDDRVVRLELQGVKDNRRGLGAIVELRAGPLYQRWYWDGAPRSVSVGSAAQLDVLRVTWPNGVVQTLTDLAAPAAYVVRQREGLVGSCPFLYTWNGEQFVFVSDVLGITPLGLPMDFGTLVPPDHDEYVLVRGDQLVPEDGFFELQFTEELREVTYLDRIRLDVVDHPAEVEVQPNERFTFPPFPEPHTHAVREVHAPLRAVDQAGRDWTAALARPDEELARPFTPQRGQYLGLADPHFVELTFDEAVFGAAERFRLLMTGWLYWTDASVNVASAGHPQIEFVPPFLRVPDGAGGWVAAGPPLGFPAGKWKTMVVDVTPFVNREDPRLRIESTLALYWDSIRLAVDEGDAELRVTPLEPASAHLWERGFSEPIPLQGDDQLDWFEWDTLCAEPRWDQHPGFYTRFGETLPLVTAVDDRYVIMGSGDALTVRFAADGLPPVPAGWTRSYLVFLDGWAKDRDPNTETALYVEPLPFHGMSGYPYPATEHFPDTPAHRAWREEWNTRPAKRWIQRLAPVAPR